jgi:hypothetical protein
MINHDFIHFSVLVHTASQTFENATFSQLNNLNLKGAVFSVGNMANYSDTDALTVYTASFTFIESTFETLSALDLNGVKFATDNMISFGNVFTGYSTFYSAEFLTLNDLFLTNCVFASSSTGIENYCTAYETFANANFPNLINLNCNDVILFVNDIVYERIFVADRTFRSALFSRLEQLDLPDYNSPSPSWTETFDNIDNDGDGITIHSYTGGRPE